MLLLHRGEQEQEHEQEQESNRRFLISTIGPSIESSKYQPERRRAGVSPAGSTSVPLVGSGGGTPPELAAGDGCATMPVRCDRPDVIVITDEGQSVYAGVV
jgi:hypothetical protein